MINALQYTLYIVSFLLGSLLMAFNGLMLIWGWTNIIKKKSIALGISIIVIKYAFLVGILFYLVTSGKYNIFSILVGILFTLVTGLSWAIARVSKKMKKAIRV